MELQNKNNMRMNLESKPKGKYTSQMASLIDENKILEKALISARDTLVIVSILYKSEKCLDQVNYINKLLAK